MRTHTFPSSILLLRMPLFSPLRLASHSITLSLCDPQLPAESSGPGLAATSHYAKCMLVPSCPSISFPVSYFIASEKPVWSLLCSLHLPLLIGSCRFHNRIKIKSDQNLWLIKYLIPACGDACTLIAQNLRN